MEKQKFIRHVILFIFLSVAMYIPLTLLWGLSGLSHIFSSNLVYKRGAYGHMYTRMQEVKQTHNVDILVLGSSHAYRGFDPRYFADSGYNMFNLGSSAQSPIQTKLLLERYLDQLRPKLVVYEVYPGVLGSDGIESALDIISNDRNDISSVRMAVNTCNIKVYTTMIYALFSDAFNLSRNYRESKRTDEDEYIPGGFVERRMSYYTVNKADRRIVRAADIAYKNLKESISLLKERNIDYILVWAPVTKEYFNAYANIEAIDSMLSSCGEYYNFNRIMTLDDSLHFYDVHHLNQSGVEKFNKRLLDILRTREIKKSRH